MKGKSGEVALYSSALAGCEERTNESEDKMEHGSKTCQERPKDLSVAVKMSFKQAQVHFVVWSHYTVEGGRQWRNDPSAILTNPGFLMFGFDALKV